MHTPIIICVRKSKSSPTGQTDEEDLFFMKDTALFGRNAREESIISLRLPNIYWCSRKSQDL